VLERRSDGVTELVHSRRTARMWEYDLKENSTIYRSYAPVGPRFLGRCKARCEEVRENESVDIMSVPLEANHGSVRLRLPVGTVGLNSWGQGVPRVNDWDYL